MKNRMIVLLRVLIGNVDDLTFKGRMFILCLYILGGGSMFQVQKWGNSLGIRIPKSLALKVGIEEGSEVDLDVEDGHLIIKPKSATLDEILSQVTPENLHKEVPTGELQGREVW